MQEKVIAKKRMATKKRPYKKRVKKVVKQESISLLLFSKLIGFFISIYSFMSSCLVSIKTNSLVKRMRELQDEHEEE